MSGLVPDSFNVTVRVDNYTLVALALLGAGFIVMLRVK